MRIQKPLRRLIGLVSILFLVGCAPAAGVTPTSLPPPATSFSPSVPTATVVPTKDLADEPLDESVATLSSLEQVDDYPLYTMRYYGAYKTAASPGGVVEGGTGTNHPDAGPAASLPAWGCSLFAALGDPGGRLYGRNFDWQYSPAVLLFTDPPNGYASVSMVDIAYLFDLAEATALTDLPLEERSALLRAPFLPFDGMNEHGLAVGMAAVPPAEMPHDPDRETIGSLRMIREMLDHARNVDDAIALLGRYNLDWQGGPPLHYLIADVSGRAVLVEFYQGEMIVIPNETSWHQATNFLRTTAGETAQGKCFRYDKIHRRLTKAEGRLPVPEAMALLSQVSQDGRDSGTQWSIVYGMSTGEINVSMGQKYEDVHTFHLSLVDE